MILFLNCIKFETPENLELSIYMKILWKYMRFFIYMKNHLTSAKIISSTWIWACLKNTQLSLCTVVNRKRLVSNVQGYLVSAPHCTFNFTRAIRKEIKITQVGKVEVKLYLFADEVILCKEKIQDSTRKLSVLIN